jgi:hypothetical protein
VSSRALLWAAFAVVHVLVAVLGWVLPNWPMGDVYLVYEPWARDAVSGRGIVGITEPFVYPQLALVPMVLAEALSWIGGYIIAWSVLVTGLNAVAFAVLLGRGRSSPRRLAAWFWIAFIALLGPIGMYRIDAITVPIALLALLWIARRPVVGAALLALGMWIKVWPVALIAAAFVALRRRVTVAATVGVFSAAVLGVVAALGGWAHAFSFVGEQTGRGLQLEAPVSMVYVWRAAAGIEGSTIYYDPDMLTYQVTGPNVDVVIAVMTPLLALAAIAVMALGAVKASRGATFLRLLPPLSLALVLVLIVFNKVGSPQFMTWLAAPVVLWLVIDRSRAWLPAGLALAVAAVTQVVYPIAYYDLLIAEPYAVVLLTARNALTVALLVVAIVRLLRVPTPGRQGWRARRADAADRRVAAPPRAPYRRSVRT